MAFSANPLSLSVPEAAFETWLRDTGYLEILDERASSAAADLSPPASLPFPSDVLLCHRATATKSGLSTDAVERRSFAAVISFFRTLVSLFTINPFAKLTPKDFAGGTPSWTRDFIGCAGSYSWPSGPSQARMRIQENVRRYARNYAFLSVLIFACSLYEMPISILGLVVSLVLWELVKFCSDKWGLEDRFPGLKQALVRIAQFATAVVLYLCNLQLAVFYATGVSYAVMIFHALLRKLTPSKQSSGANRYRRFRQKKLQFGIK